jgi:beta-lactam-binding protein with PASTA domain
MNKLYLYILVPFIAFFSGFLFIQRYVSFYTFPAPDVIGSSLETATKKLAAHRLNIRITGEKQDKQLAPNTVISQNPAPSSMVKPEQTIYLLISKQPDKQLTPNLRNLSVEEITKKIDPQLTRIITHAINTAGPHNKCIFHLPEAGSPLTEELHLYLNKQCPIIYVMPSLKGLSLSKALEIMRYYNIQYKIIAASDAARWQPFNYLQVINHTPQAGAELTANPDLIELIVN